MPYKCALFCGPQLLYFLSQNYIIEDESEDAKKLQQNFPHWKNILPRAIWRCKDPKTSKIKPCSHIPKKLGRFPIMINFPLEDLPVDLDQDCSRLSQDPELKFWKCGEVNTCVRDQQPCMKDSIYPQCQDGYQWMVIFSKYTNNPNNLKEFRIR